MTDINEAALKIEELKHNLKVAARGLMNDPRTNPDDLSLLLLGLVFEAGGSALVHNHKYREHASLKIAKTCLSAPGGIHGADGIAPSIECKSGSVSGKTISWSTSIASFDKIHTRVSETVEVSREKILGEVKHLGGWDVIPTDISATPTLVRANIDSLRKMKIMRDLCLKSTQDNIVVRPNIKIDKIAPGGASVVVMSLFGKTSIQPILVLQASPKDIEEHLGDFMDEKLLHYNEETDLRRKTGSSKSGAPRDDYIVRLDHLKKMGKTIKLIYINYEALSENQINFNREVFDWIYNIAPLSIQNTLRSKLEKDAYFFYKAPKKTKEKK